MLRHEIDDGPGLDVGGAAGEIAAQVAVGKKADDAAGAIHDGDGAGLDLGHGDDGGSDRCGNRDGGEAVAGSHDVVHFEQEGAADGAAGVERGIFLAGEAAGFEQRDGEGVADRQRDGGGGGGDEIERAGFTLDGSIEDDVRVLGKGGIQGAGQGDDAHAGALENGQQVDELVRFAGVGQREDGVFGLEQAEVAVHGLGGVQNVGRRAGAGEGGGDLLADVEGFADAGDDDLAAAGQRGPERLDRGVERAVEPLAGAPQGGDLDVENGLGFFQMGSRAHGRNLAETSGQGKFSTARKITRRHAKHGKSD